MTRCMGLFAVAFLVLPAAAQDKDEKKVEGFAFPSDLAGKRLEKLLQPGDVDRKGLLRTTPLPRSAPRFIEEPDMQPRTTHLVPPRLELPGKRVVNPLHPAEPIPLASYTQLPQKPQPITLPAGELAYWPSVPVEKMPELPILGTPRSDRAALGDPTMEASLAATLRVFSFARSGPLAFSPVNLPDPFELRQRVELRDPPEESSMPPVVAFPRLPAK